LLFCYGRIKKPSRCEERDGSTITNPEVYNKLTKIIIAYLPGHIKGSCWKWIQISILTQGTF